MAVHRRWLITALAGLALPALAAAPVATHPAAVSTPGHADLRKCRLWLVFDTCKTYHDVAIPARVRRGDHFRIDFGSNPKSFVFEVADIVLSGQACWLQVAANPQADPGLAVDTLIATPCRAGPGG